MKGEKIAIMNLKIFKVVLIMVREVVIGDGVVAVFDEDSKLEYEWVRKEKRDLVKEVLLRVFSDVVLFYEIKVELVGFFVKSIGRFEIRIELFLFIGVFGGLLGMLDLRRNGGCFRLFFCFGVFENLGDRIISVYGFCCNRE